MEEDVRGFFAPVHRALTEPILLGGAPRTVAIANGTLAGAVGLGLRLWIAGLVIWAIGHFAAVWAAKRDAQFVDVGRRHLRYSIDSILPKERFQAPVRVRAFALASSPSLAEIDLGSWRPDHEISDRPQIENSAALLVEDLKVTANQVNAPLGYQALVDLAPEFLKEFTTRMGLSVNRYWREAVGRAGEPRSDRKTVAIVGPLYTEQNATRLLSVLDYGLRDKNGFPEFILSAAPQAPLWGATTQQRDLLSLIRRKVGINPLGESIEMKAICLFAGKPPRYVERTFDEVHSTDSTEFPPALELLLIPQVIVAAVVHAPIGAISGQAVPLGLASFDQEVIGRAQSLIADRMHKFVKDDERCVRYCDALISG